jgi:hypothetical protein
LAVEKKFEARYFSAIDDPIRVIAMVEAYLIVW